MKIKIIWISIFVSFCLLGVYIFKMNQNSNELPLRLVISEPLESFDPAKVFNNDGLKVLGQVIEPLYQYHYLKRPLEIVPALAREMPRYELGGKRAIIDIKRGVFYHDHPILKGFSREVKAQDFVFAIKRLNDPKVNSPGAFLFKDNLKDLYAKGDYQLVFEFKKPEPNLLYYLSMFFCSPLPAEILSENPDFLETDIIGTGPYQIKSVDDKKLELSKNQNFRLEYYPTEGDRFAHSNNFLNAKKKQRLPFIESIIFYYHKASSDKWDAFWREELDLFSVPSLYTSEILGRKFDKDDSVELLQLPRLAMRWLGFNWKHPYLSDLRLRLAISHAIDVKEFIRLFSANTNLKANSYFAPGIDAYKPYREKSIPYHPLKAKKYFEQFLKAKKMKAKDVRLKFSTRGKQESYKQMAFFIKESLQKIGLAIDVDILEFKDFIRLGRSGQLEFFLDGWIYDYPDGDNILQLLYSKNCPGVNKSCYSNNEFDRLYEDLKSETNAQNRIDSMHKIEDIVSKDAPWIPLMYESSFILKTKRVINYRKHFLIRNHLKYLKIIDEND